MIIVAKTITVGNAAPIMGIVTMTGTGGANAWITTDTDQP